jgi:hypothetical protein
MATFVGMSFLALEIPETPVSVVPAWPFESSCREKSLRKVSSLTRGQAAIRRLDKAASYRHYNSCCKSFARLRRVGATELLVCSWALWFESADQICVNRIAIREVPVFFRMT